MAGLGRGMEARGQKGPELAQLLQEPTRATRTARLDVDSRGGVGQTIGGTLGGT